MTHTARARQTAPEGRLRARCGVLEGLALLGLGRREEGRRACLGAAHAARAENAPELVGEAALALGSVFRFASVDRDLVTLCEDALGRLPQEDSRLRAQLLARLAAARQPDPVPARPIALAWEAIAMAERLGDKAALVATLRASASAMVDLAHPGERRPLDERHLALALELGSAADELAARQRLIFDCAELGDFASAERHLERAAELARAAAQPRDRWRAPALGALLGLWRGELGEVGALLEEARAGGAAAGDGNAAATHAFQRARYIELSGQEEEADAIAAALGRTMTGSVPAERLAAMARAGFFLELGRTAEALAAIDGEGVRAVLAIGDRTMLHAAARWAAAAGDGALGAAVAAKLPDGAALFSSHGVLGLCWRGPAALVLAYAVEAQGELEQALRWAEAAVGEAQRVGSPPAVVEARVEAARLAARLGRGALAEVHAEKARAQIERFCLRGPGRRLDALLRERAAPMSVGAAVQATTSDSPSFGLEGEIFAIRWGGREVRVKATKGLAVLAYLVEHPSEDVHVLDLAHLDRAVAPVDKGDSGEVMDARARAAYRARAEDLREELAEAEDHHDLGRVERVRAELEAIADALLAGTGRGGRSRRAPGAEERARQAVQKQIRAALSRIREVFPELARYLERAVQTGRTCRFEP